MGEAISQIDVQRTVRLGNQVTLRRRTVSDWRRVWAILSKQWRWSALFAAIVIVAVTGVTLALRPIYEPEGQLQIDPPGAEAFSLQTPGGGLDSEYIATEAQKLQTDDLALATIRALHLDTNPEVTGKVASQSAANLIAGQLTPRENAAIRGFQSKLTIRREPSSRLVGVRFATHDPRLSADVVNTLMRLLVERNFEERNEAIAQSSMWLSRQLDDIRDKMEHANHALAEFGTKTGIADVDPNSNTYAEKMGDLNKQLVQAESDRIQFESFLKRGADPDTLPQVRNSPVVQALMQKLAEAQAQRAQARVLYGPNHLEVRKLESQISELQALITLQRTAIISELSTNYLAARSREELLSGEVKDATTDLATLAQYNVLKKEAQADRDLYDALYAKIKEAGISAASKSSNIHVVNQARVLDHPTRPNRTLNIAAGIMIALLGGVAIAFVKDRMQDRIQTTDDVREWTGSPAIAVVPAIHNGHNGVRRLGRNGTKLTLLDAMADVADTDEPRWNGAGALAPDCFLLQRPSAPESEAVHALLSMLFLSQPEHPPKVILLTSSLPGEGKTTLANNLAIALAKHGRTCLVDADLRKPAVGASFKLTPGTGLEHYLRGSANFDQVTYPSSQVRNLTIIPATMATDNAIELLTDEPVRILVKRLRERFDFTVIDTPPLLPYADALVLSTLVDGVVLVGRAGQTPRGALARSMELLSAINSAPILSVVLNAASQRDDYSAYSYRLVAG